MNRFLLACIALVGFCLPGPAFSAVNVDSAFFNSNWKVMAFHQSGTKVSSEYIYDKGVITATFYGDTLRGWWREYNNDQTCGPGGIWSGAIAFLFSADGKSFTGDWNYCADSGSVLNPKSTRWTGDRRDSGFTQAECLDAGRFWCQNTCQIAACGTILTQDQCLKAGRFWCSNDCSLEACPAGIKPKFKTEAWTRSFEQNKSITIDILGRCMDEKAARLTPQTNQYILTR